MHNPGFINAAGSLLAFDLLDLDALAFDVEAQPAEEAHILVGHPDQREAADQVAAPIVVEQLVARDDEEKGRHIMAETVFAGEQVEKFSLDQSPTSLATFDTILARLAEDF